MFKKIKEWWNKRQEKKRKEKLKPITDKMTVVDSTIDSFIIADSINDISKLKFIKDEQYTGNGGNFGGGGASGDWGETKPEPKPPVDPPKTLLDMPETSSESIYSSTSYSSSISGTDSDITEVISEVISSVID